MASSNNTTLSIRKLADRTVGQRVKRFHPLTGEPALMDPEDGQLKPWPLVGIKIEGETPDYCRVPMSFVTGGMAEGWVTLENGRPKHQPGGPPDDPWKITHTFMQADYIVIKTVDGDVRFKVTSQPDKYDDERQPSGKRVDWFYDLELVKA